MRGQKTATAKHPCQAPGEVNGGLIGRTAPESSARRRQSRWKASKDFFFEKKKQKTFLNLDRGRGTGFG